MRHSLVNLLPYHGRSPSLRRRILSYFGIVGVFAGLAVSLGTWGFVSSIETQAWRGRQGEAARAAAQTVAGFIGRATDSLAFIGLLGKDEMEDDPGVMKTVLRQDPALTEVVYIDAQGKALAGAAQDRPLLANLFTIPQSEWFRAAHAGQPYYGSIQLSSLDEPYLIIALPGEDGAVVAARVHMQVLWDTVAEIHFGKAGAAYVVTHTGQIIAHTDPAVVLANSSVSRVPGLQAMLQAPEQQWYGQFSDLAGLRVVGATAPVPGTDWLVITELPRSEAFAASRRALLVLGGSTALGALLGLWLSARFLNRMILAPMEVLRRGSERIGQGDLSHRIGLTRRDEVGQVAAAFDAMAASLSAKTSALVAEVSERKRAEEALRILNEDLEARVVDRTAALAEINDALRASEERYRTVLEDMPALVCRFLPNGVLTFVNEQYCSYFGVPRDDLLGQEFYQFIPPEDRKSLAEYMASLTPESPVKSYEHQVVAADGTLRWQLWTDRALFDVQGAAVEYQSIGQDVTERRQAEQRIRASLREKEAMLKEIHHRVKNNLQVISSLLSLQATYIEDERAQEMFQDSQNRIRSMALIHERLYQSPDLSSIDLGQYIDSLVDDLFRAYGPRASSVTHHLDTEQVYLPIDTAIPCSLIVNELVSNALKHAFPEGRVGQVCVSLHRDGDTLRLRIADDGVGLPAGFSLASSPSLGLQLVVTLVDQIRGTLSHRSSAGTEFQIDLPAPR